MTDTLSGLHRILTYYDGSYPPDVLGGGSGPKITALAPNTAVAGSPPLTVTVTGSGFDPDAVIEAGGSALTTTVVNSSELTATFDPTTAGAVVFTVRNVGSTAESNNMTFTVAPTPAPTLSGVVPNTSAAGAGTTNLTLTGTGFVSRSQVRVDGASRPTTLVSPTQVTATLTAAMQATAGTLAIDVFTAAPGGGTSPSVPFEVT